MSIGLFVDKAHPPTMEQIFEAVGPRRPAWGELTRLLREQFKAREEFKFYGRNYGWALRFRKSGKALVSLYPTGRSFTIQIILGAAETRKARGLRLGKHVERIIDEAHPYPEGRWLFIPVTSVRDIKDVERLLMLKGSARRQQK